MTQKTHTPKIQTKGEKKWFLVDATDKILGRLATEVAVTLRGKNKTTFTPHLDMGDYVVVINAEKIRVTGRKEEQKEYIRHTGYLGHLRKKPIARLRVEHPERIISEAVAGMVPRNKLKKFVMAKLHVYAGSDHPHGGQNPIVLNV